MDPAAQSQPWLHDLAICVDGNGTALSAADGSMTRGAEGFYVDDQRAVSRFTVALAPRGGGPDDGPLVSVATASSGARSDFFTSARHLGDPGPDPTVEVHRRRQVSGARLVERLSVVSRGAHPVEADLIVVIGGDGAEISAVKTGRAEGPLLAAHLDGPGGASWKASRLAARVRFTPAPAGLVGDQQGARATFPVWLEAGAELTVEVEVAADRLGSSVFPADAGSAAVDWGATVEVRAGDSRLSRLVGASLADLQSLLLTDPLQPRDFFAAAGTPWYLTLFGRDSLWTARMALPLGTELAAGTLRTLGRRQGTKVDPATAEAPGKIPHELRRTAYVDDALGFSLPPVYYGTVDATALWVCLLHDAWRWGLPDDEVRVLLPELRAATRWLTEAAAPDGDGLIKYVDESGHGLVNQGWKDSGDSMRFRDGRVADAPIALVEAQAYAVEAATGAAALLAAVGDEASGDAVLARSLVSWADAMAQRMRRDFWTGEQDARYLALAIDGHGRPVDGLGSNMGHVLGTGALTASEEELVATTLMGPSLLGRHGIRTLASDNGGFNPIGYHTGSVWVHDTAICALGMARASHGEKAARLARRLLDAAEAFDYRLPELFSDTGVLGRPAPYPASCRPQAWASASAIAVLTIALGLSVDVPGRTITVRPAPGGAFGPVQVRGVRVAGSELLIEVDAAGEVTVSGLPEGFRLVT